MSRANTHTNTHIRFWMESQSGHTPQNTSLNLETGAQTLREEKGTQRDKMIHYEYQKYERPRTDPTANWIKKEKNIYISR